MPDNDDNTADSNDGGGDVQIAPPVESRGEALPAPVRHKMEASLASDFSDVRVHQGHEATHLGAIAFTRGSNIFFSPGHYQPASESGERHLAHELTHVVQQAQGRVAALAPGLVRKP